MPRQSNREQRHPDRAAPPIAGRGHRPLVDAEFGHTCRIAAHLRKVTMPHGCAAGTSVPPLDITCDRRGTDAADPHVTSRAEFEMDRPARDE